MTIPEEVYAEMDKAFALGKNHDDGLPVDDTQLGIEWAVDILKSTVDTQRAADDKTINKLSNALRYARDQFLFYERIHTKGNKVGIALTNKKFADVCEQALSDHEERIAEAQEGENE